MTLPADAQRFLGHHYRQDLAAIFDGDLAGVKSGGHAQFGRDAWCFATYPDGVGWSRPDEDHDSMLVLADWPHRVRWAAVLAHLAAQPMHLRDRLHDARTAYIAEHRRHWDAMTAINAHWYWHATPDQIADLDAEVDAHYAADRRRTADLHAALLDLLPLATDEPADLIEWAAALA